MAWKPRWVWRRSSEQRAASRTGLAEPLAKGATERGTRPAAMRRSNVQWYEPWDGEGAGTGAASLTADVEC